MVLAVACLALAGALPGGASAVEQSDPIVPGHGEDPLPPPASEEEIKKRLKALKDKPSHKDDFPPGGAPGHTYVLPPEEYGPHCSAPDDRQFLVVYAWANPPIGEGNRFGPQQGNRGNQAAASFRRMSNKLAYDGLRSGGPVVRPRVYCGGVLSAQVTNKDPQVIVDQVTEQLRPNHRIKMAIFVDFIGNDTSSYVRPVPYEDSTPSSANLNNNPDEPRVPSPNAVIYRHHWGSNAVTHEVLHAMGAVQQDSPSNNDIASTTAVEHHCNDGIDVMCYRQGSQPYGEQYCTEGDALSSFWTQYSFHYATGALQPPADCTKWDPVRPWSTDGGDYFFAGTPSGYLSDHWNIARAYNGFIWRDDLTP